MNLDSLELMVFESPLRRNLEPFSLTKPTFDFLLGAKTLLRRIEAKLSRRITNLVVPRYLEAICREAHPDCKINSDISSPCLAVNSLVSPSYDLANHVLETMQDRGKDFAVLDAKKNVIFAIIETFNSKNPEVSLGRVVKKIPQESAQPSLLEYPWQMISENSGALELDYERLLSKGAIQHSSGQNGPEFLGKKSSVAPSAQIDLFVTLDSRGGPIIIDEDVIVQSFSHISGPCYVGKSSIIKSAGIGPGTSIGKECRVGGEVESTIMNDYSNKAHEGFLGHSIVGSWVNLGALTTNSDLKNTYGNINVQRGGKRVDTGSIKVGCFLSDMCKTSIGTLIFAGKFVGVCSNIFGIVSTDVPSFTFFSSTQSTKSREMYLNSAIETQFRMMQRRKLQMSEGFKRMIESVFKMTVGERRASGVKTGKFRI